MCNVVKPDLYFVVVGLRASGEEMHEGPALFFSCAASNYSHNTGGHGTEAWRG